VGAVSLGELDGFAGSLAEVIQFCPPCFAASDGPDIENVGRIKRENPFHTLVIDNPPNCKGLVNAAALAGDYSAGKYLRALFVTFFDAAVDIYNIAYFEVRFIFLQTFAFNRIQYFGFHSFIS